MLLVFLVMQKNTRRTKIEKQETQSANKQEIQNTLKQEVQNTKKPETQTEEKQIK